MKMTEKEAREIAVVLESEFNPYIAKATPYNRGLKRVYLYNGRTMDEVEIREAYIETATKDIIRGFNERMVGYYDKWYRYNHADEGRAYDKGVKLAISEPKCKPDFNIIECMA